MQGPLYGLRHNWSIDRSYKNKLGTNELEELEGSKVFGWCSDPRTHGCSFFLASYEKKPPEQDGI